MWYVVRSQESSVRSQESGVKSQASVVRSRQIDPSVRPKYGMYLISELIAEIICMYSPNVVRHITHHSPRKFVIHSPTHSHNSGDRAWLLLQELLSEHGGELSYRLPFTSASSFPALLKHLDTAKQALGLGGYGMSPTSLEEVFLRLAQVRC